MRDAIRKVRDALADREQDLATGIVAVGEVVAVPAAQLTVAVRRPGGGVQLWPRTRNYFNPAVGDVVLMVGRPGSWTVVGALAGRSNDDNLSLGGTIAANTLTDRLGDVRNGASSPDVKTGATKLSSTAVLGALARLDYWRFQYVHDTNADWFAGPMLPDVVDDPVLSTMARASDHEHPDAINTQSLAGMVAAALPALVARLAALEQARTIKLSRAVGDLPTLAVNVSTTRLCAWQGTAPNPLPALGGCTVVQVAGTAASLTPSEVTKDGVVVTVRSSNALLAAPNALQVVAAS